MYLHIYTCIQMYLHRCTCIQTSSTHIVCKCNLHVCVHVRKCNLPKYACTYVNAICTYVPAGARGRTGAWRPGWWQGPGCSSLLEDSAPRSSQLAPKKTYTRTSGCACVCRCKLLSSSSSSASMCMCTCTHARECARADVRRRCR